jgi:hypothetical protein
VVITFDRYLIELKKLIKSSRGPELLLYILVIKGCKKVAPLLSEVVHKGV